MTLALCARNGHLRESDLRSLTIQVSAGILLDSIRDFINQYEHDDEIGRTYGLQELIKITNHKYTHAGGTDSIEDEISQHTERYTSDPRLKTLYDLYLKVMHNKKRPKNVSATG